MHVEELQLIQVNDQSYQSGNQKLIWYDKDELSIWQLSSRNLSRVLSTVSRGYDNDEVAKGEGSFNQAYSCVGILQL